MAAFAAPTNVEAVIPPGLLQHFQVVVFDYAARTMTLAQPGTLKPDGVAVPIRVNPKTGFAMLDATIDGAPHVFVLDNGGSYSGIRDAAPLLAAHPERLRVTGGVGMANLTMQASDAGMPVVKVPRGRALWCVAVWTMLGLLQMAALGVLGGLPWTGRLLDRIYSPKAGEPGRRHARQQRAQGFPFDDRLPELRDLLASACVLRPDTASTTSSTMSASSEGVDRAVTTALAVERRRTAWTPSAASQPGDKLVKIDGRDTHAMTLPKNCWARCTRQAWANSTA